MLNLLADIASIISAIVAVVTLCWVAPMAKVVHRNFSQSSSQLIKGKNITQTSITQTANEHHPEK